MDSCQMALDIWKAKDKKAAAAFVAKLPFPGRTQAHPRPRYIVRCRRCESLFGASYPLAKWCSSRCSNAEHMERREGRAIRARLKQCATCGKSFQSGRTDGKFCSTACRVKAHRQKAAIAAEALPHFEEEAKKRMECGTNQHSPSPKLDEGTKGRSDEHAAKSVGVSRGYVADAKKIKEASKCVTSETKKVGKFALFCESRPNHQNPAELVFIRVSSHFQTGSAYGI
jgi:hypothetical protein